MKKLSIRNQIGLEYTNTKLFKPSEDMWNCCRNFWLSKLRQKMFYNTLEEKNDLLLLWKQPTNDRTWVIFFNLDSCTFFSLSLSQRRRRFGWGGGRKFFFASRVRPFLIFLLKILFHPKREKKAAEIFFLWKGAKSASFDRDSNWDRWDKDHHTSHLPTTLWEFNLLNREILQLW